MPMDFMRKKVNSEPWMYSHLNKRMTVILNLHWCQPKEPLVGHYWIEVTKGGNGYLIHGVNESHEDEKIHWVMDETGNLQTIPFTD